MLDKLIASVGEENAAKLIRLTELHAKLWNGEGLDPEEDREHDELVDDLSSSHVLPLC